MRFTLIFMLLFAVAFPLFSQVSVSPERNEVPFSYIGMKLEDMLGRFGVPQAVHASRGDEQWQDDVVFVYGEGDFYVYRDRVWQVRVRSVFGINTGDVKAVALLVLGDNVRDEGEYLLYNIPGGGWPVSLRINFAAGRVSAIFVYRPDFH
jgi:hypothetical protein